MQTTRPRIMHMEGFTNGRRRLKEIFDQVRKDLDCEFIVLF